MLQFERGIFEENSPENFPERYNQYDLSGNPFEEKETMEIAKSLIETLKQLCIFFNGSDIKFCLVGGLAVGILAKPRATEDIDLLVLIDEEDIETIGSRIRHDFDIIQEHELMHFKHATIWRIVFKDYFTEDTGLVIVDLILANNEIYKKTVVDVIKLKIDNIEIPVAKPENLIKMKKLSNRPQDRLDIQSIAEAMIHDGEKTP